MNKYIIQNESGKQFIAGPVTIEKPSIPVEFNEIEESKAMFRYGKKLALYDDHILSLPRYEWQGEKRERGDEVVEGVDFEFWNKDKNDCCPECGCEEYECEDYLGKGFRNCKSCGQEWWLDVKYSSRFCKVAIPLSKAVKPNFETQEDVDFARGEQQRELTQYPKAKTEEVKEKEDGWISVEDKLPSVGEKFKESDYVLAIDQFGGDQVVCWYSQLHGWRVAHYRSNSEPINVTHWRLLPPPPKS